MCPVVMQTYLLDGLENIFHSQRNDPRSMLAAHHGERLTGTSLTVREHGSFRGKTDI